MLTYSIACPREYLKADGTGACILSKMYRRAVSRLLCLLLSLITVVVSADSARTNYEELLVSERMKEKLELVEPKILLQNFKTVDGDAGNSIDQTCARDLATYLQAVDRRELWALKSKSGFL